jgi:DNA-directed RNA polymerase specialized sigma24 family protein
MGPREGQSAEPYALHAERVRALPLLRLRKELLEKAGFWGMKQDAAEDAVQTAVIRLIKKGQTEWDHVADPEAWRFLLKATNEARKNARRKVLRRRTDLDTEAVEEAPPSSDAGSRTVLLHREHAAEGRKDLLARIRENPVAVQVVEVCMREGDLRAGEIAEHLGIDVQRVYKAKERIAEVLRQMVEERAAAPEGA